MPFYGNRAVTMLPTLEDLQRQLAQPGSQAVMMERGVFRKLMKKNALGDLKRYTVFRPEFPGKADDFLVLLSEAETPQK